MKYYINQHQTPVLPLKNKGKRVPNTKNRRRSVCLQTRIPALQRHLPHPLTLRFAIWLGFLVSRSFRYISSVLWFNWWVFLMETFINVVGSCWLHFYCNLHWSIAINLVNYGHALYPVGSHFLLGSHHDSSPNKKLISSLFENFWKFQ